ncbi:AEC family transporter [Paraburkholderia humisilvae]|uniref:Transporter YfdV n=1 Tax=Paraburkholderia humisilvae TaxID=627669 RepID=A0A6J5F7G7_9BURK|nr:AEC family transporter [Paraburkholderia humisilvae]CAB3774848.1 hypothetical protein LMG29542_08230 [Paraburkholderia humisilvae]
MISTIKILLPVFALIAAGFVCRRRGILGPTAASELNRFVVYLAFPGLLFAAMANASWGQLDLPGFVATVGLSCAVVFIVVLVWRLASGRELADASVNAIAASYPNAGYIGIPLCLIVFGPSSLTPATIVNVLVGSVLFGASSVLVEVGTRKEAHRLTMLLTVLRSLGRNPMLIAPLAGAIISGLHVTLPASVDTFLKLLGGAASPAALVGLGIFLAEKQAPEAQVTRDSLILIGAKLLIQPVLAWWLAARVFFLPNSLVGVAVILAALPTGTGPYMLAEFYKRQASVTSRTIMLSTIMSVISLPLLITYIHTGR